MELTVSESTERGLQTLSAEGRERLRQLIAESCQPIAPFWPMKSFAKRNPLQGLEHLPFDRAVREAKNLLGGKGYLSNGEYRQLFREGRMTEENVSRAFQRVGPSIHTQTFVHVGTRRIGSADVLRLHLLFGFNSLDPVLLTWTMGAAAATRRFQDDLPAESRRRIKERAAGDSALAGKNVEESYVMSLWNSTLSALRLSDRSDRDSHDPRQSGSEPRRAATEPASEVTLPTQRTVGDWLDGLAGASIVEQINAQMTKWTAAFVDEGMAGWPMPSQRHRILSRLARTCATGSFRPIPRHKELRAKSSRSARFARRGNRRRPRAARSSRRAVDGIPVAALSSIARLGGLHSLAR